MIPSFSFSDFSYNLARESVLLLFPIKGIGHLVNILQEISIQMGKSVLIVSACEVSALMCLTVLLNPY